MKKSIKDKLKLWTKLQIISFQSPEWKEVHHKYSNQTREITKVQTNAIKIDTSRLYFWPASQSEDLENNTFKTWQLDSNWNKDLILTYKIYS